MAKTEDSPKKLSFDSLKAFYPYYLSEHQDGTCRTLHFIGTTILLGIAVSAVVTGRYKLLWFLPLAGYGFAWAGHFFFEKNRPATFQFPLYSLVSDFIMYWHILTGQIGKRMAEAVDLYGAREAS